MSCRGLGASGLGRNCQRMDRFKKLPQGSNRRKRIESWLTKAIALRTPVPDILVGIELRRAGCRWRVTKPALSIASWVLISTVATFSEAPL